MNAIIRWSLILFLLLISVLASVFIVIESGTFYQQFYNQSLSILHMGYWAAMLTEVFMAVMAATWLPNKISQKGKRVHPANYFFKAILGVLFITTVGGASFNSIAPILEKIQDQNNRTKIVTVLESQVEDNSKSFTTFSKQNQKTNTALAARNQIKAKEELKENIGDIKNTFLMWFQIFFIVFLRLGVQFSNLSCVWLIGWLYREKDNKVLEKGKALESTPSFNPISIRRFGETRHRRGWSTSLSFEKLKNRVLKNSEPTIFSDATDVAAYREKIKLITNRLFTSVSMQKCCSELEIQVTEMTKILNYKISLNSSYLPTLREVYQKLVGFQQQSKAI